LKTVLVSGGFDPLHTGHLRLFKGAAEHGKLIVAINSDDWLMRKKGFSFMPWDDRKEMIESLNCVWSVISFNDDDGTAVDAIRQARPDFFANAGDRDPLNLPKAEIDFCGANNVGMLWDVVPNNERSSSIIAANANPRTKRPWGWFEVLYDGPDCKVKRICVNPQSSISLQYHNKRSELWQVIEGYGHLTLDEKIDFIRTGDTVKIPEGAIHRVENPAFKDDENLVFIEVQQGSYFGEDDIIRFDDQYGRHNS
jgi:cytidyltransferase-like protein